MNDIIVHLIDLPTSVKGHVRETPEGDYLIFINSRYNEIQQKEIYEHELRHIIRNHFYTPTSLTTAEAEASEQGSLTEEIIAASKYGVPLPTPKPARELPKFEDVQIHRVEVGDFYYDLPEGITEEDVREGFEDWLEKAMDYDDRFNDFKQFGQSDFY